MQPASSLPPSPSPCPLQTRGRGGGRWSEPCSQKTAHNFFFKKTFLAKKKMKFCLYTCELTVSWISFSVLNEKVFYVLGDDLLKYQSYVCLITQGRCLQWPRPSPIFSSSCFIWFLPASIFSEFHN